MCALVASGPRLFSCNACSSREDTCVVSRRFNPLLLISLHDLLCSQWTQSQASSVDLGVPLMVGVLHLLLKQLEGPDVWPERHCVLLKDKLLCFEVSTDEEPSESCAVESGGVVEAIDELGPDVEPPVMVRDVVFTVAVSEGSVEGLGARSCPALLTSSMLATMHAFIVRNAPLYLVACTQDGYADDEKPVALVFTPKPNAQPFVLACMIPAERDAWVHAIEKALQAAADKVLQTCFAMLEFVKWIPLSIPDPRLVPMSGKASCEGKHDPGIRVDTVAAWSAENACTCVKHRSSAHRYRATNGCSKLIVSTV